MNSRMGGAIVYLSKDNEEFTCAIQNVEVRKIETIFERVQARIGILQYRVHQIYGLEETVDWTSGHWRISSLLDQKIASQFIKSVIIQ